MLRDVQLRLPNNHRVYRFLSLQYLLTLRTIMRPPLLSKPPGQPSQRIMRLALRTDEYKFKAWKAGILTLIETTTITNLERPGQRFVQLLVEKYLEHGKPITRQNPKSLGMIIDTVSIFLLRWLEYLSLCIRHV